MSAARVKHAALTVDITAAAVNVLVVSVLAGLIGQSADPIFPAVLAVGLSALLLVHRKFPVPVLLVSLVFIDLLSAWQLSTTTSNPAPGLIVRTATPETAPFAGAWIWPATTAFLLTVLRGRWRWAAVLGAAQLAFAGYWQSTVFGLTAGQAAQQLVVDGLWLAAVVGAAVGLRRRTERASSEPARNL